MRAEYDFASMKGGVRGKYAGQYRAPADEAVNKALKADGEKTRERR